MTALSSSSPSAEASAAAAVVTVCCNGCIYLWNTGAQFSLIASTAQPKFTLPVVESNIAKLVAACYLAGGSSPGDDDIDLFTFSYTDANPAPPIIIPCTAVAVIGKLHPSRSKARRA